MGFVDINNDKAIVYGLQGQALAEKLRWKKGLISSKLDLGLAYLEKSDTVKALSSDQSAYALACRVNDPDFQGEALIVLGQYYSHLHNLAKALSCYLKAGEIAAKYHNEELQAHVNEPLAQTYREINDGTSAIPYYFKNLAYYQKRKQYDNVAYVYKQLGSCYESLKDYDKALFYIKRALKVDTKINGEYDHYLLFNISLQKKDYDQAYFYLSEMRHENSWGFLVGYRSLASARFYMYAPDSLLIKDGVKPKNRYSQYLDSVAINIKKGHPLDGNMDMATAYLHLHNYKKAYEAYKRSISLKDSLEVSNTAVIKFVAGMSSYQEAKKEDALLYQQQLTNLHYEQQKKYYLFGVIALAIISFFIFFNYFNQRKANRKITAANHRLSEQQEEITAQRDDLSAAFAKLKSAQTQLIQSEKMASLGELTAGIAHEIQNPLNFVNNFSEVSVELLDELKEEAKNGNTEEVIAIADDLSENLGKINHHGKRADSIVKGMLEHSRASTGQKEPTDINKLADEYLRLSYHGLRAKDKTFNADLITHFDEHLPLVSVIPQDIGRVLLNLLNNAFYAVNEKQKTAGTDYRPEVAVSTAIEKNNLTIKVKDNGNGIPDGIKEKIMQPFFTTKPTGEGTGLGLSLSYDIVVKGHGGKIDVDSIEGKGTTFVVTLPVS